MNKKYVRKEVLTVTRTEEVSFSNEKLSDAPVTKHQLAQGAWLLIKKYLFSYKWIGGKDDG